MKKFFFLVLAIQLIFSCKTNLEKEIIGNWECVSNSHNQTYEFKTDHTYVFRLNEFVTLNGKYKIIPEMDSLILYNEDNKLLVDFIYKIMDNKLLLINYKKHHHIDEVSLLKRGKDSSSINKGINDSGLTTLLFPKDFRGYVYICYNQELGEEKEFMENGNPILQIPSNGLLKTKLQEDPINFILGKFIFIETNSNRINKKTPFFFFTEYIGSLDKLLGKGFNMDSVYVCIYGYNQTSREEVNKVFQEPIDGNVLMLRVDTLKNMVVNPFLDTRLKKMIKHH